MSHFEILRIILFYLLVYFQHNSTYPCVNEIVYYYLIYPYLQFVFIGASNFIMFSVERNVIYAYCFCVHLRALKFN